VVGAGLRGSIPRRVPELFNSLLDLEQVMNSGEFLERIVANVVRDSEAHSDLIELCRKAKCLQSAVTSYLERHSEHDRASDSFNLATAHLAPEVLVDHQEQIEDGISDWREEVFSDVSGFRWGLDIFVDYIESQILAVLKDEEDGYEEDTVIEG
jgi:hypothetical protein